jgi:putative membrane protein
MLKKLAALPVLAFIVLIEPLQAIAQQTAPQSPPPPQGYYGPGPWHMWNGGYGGHGLWMLPLMLLLLVLVGAAFFAIARNRPRGDLWGDPSHSALQILNERFARGEIQKEEYTEKRTALMSGGRA